MEYSISCFEIKHKRKEMLNSVHEKDVLAGIWQRCLRILYILCVSGSAMLYTSCNKDDDNTVNEGAKEETLGLTIYKPQEFSNMDLNSESSTWSYTRSKESDHFILFWGKEYGAQNPNDASVPDAYRVDTDELLAKAEEFYDLNVNQLKFAETGSGKSNLDKYKMMIFLYYTADWMATGSGYDDVIGALWISPSVCQPVGRVLAHEIGHCFQYQVYCDLKGGSGYRYGYGVTGGNVYWEQTAQWQAYQSYPEEIYSVTYFPTYLANSNLHMLHERLRYENYFTNFYWAEKHGIDIVSKLWRQAFRPEDPVETYMRITGITLEQFHDEVYDAATRFVTWDLDALRTAGAEHIGEYTTYFNAVNASTATYRVEPRSCPGTTGYNVIALNVPEANTEVAIEFNGEANYSGFNTVDASIAGWRYGFVALLQNGDRIYGDMAKGTDNRVSFVVPNNCDKLWFVVTGAPTKYTPPAWDDNDANDEEWPYRLKFIKTNILGYPNVEGNDDVGAPRDVTLTYDVSFPYDASGYSGSTVSVGGSQLEEAFLVQSAEISSLMSSGKIKFYGVEPNGTLNPTFTATGYGHWFNSAGNIVNWGTTAYVFSEFNANELTSFIGQYPGRLQTGTTYTIKQALVYEYETGKTATAIFVYNVRLQ